VSIARLLAVIAAIVAVILFVLYGSSLDAKDLAYGLVAVAAAIGLLALEPLLSGTKVP
jgi:hypothetical protein